MFPYVIYNMFPYIIYNMCECVRLRVPIRLSVIVGMEPKTFASKSHVAQTGPKFAVLLLSLTEH